MDNANPNEAGLAPEAPSLPSAPHWLDLELEIGADYRTIDSMFIGAVRYCDTLISEGDPQAIARLHALVAAHRRCS